LFLTERVVFGEFMLPEYRRSTHTIQRHVSNVLGKLGISSRTAAVAEAARLDLL
jgi:DNA-binding NarL/FixJ family response regulator